MSPLAQLIIWVIIEVIIIFAVLFVLLAAKVLTVRDYPSMTNDLDIDMLKTGDILGVSYPNPFGWFVTAWSDSIWSHVGIVWRDPQSNYPYILEAADYGGKYTGLIVIPINEWLHINRHNLTGYMSINVSPDANLLMDNFKPLMKYGLDAYNYNWIRLIQTRKYIPESFDIPNTHDKKVRYVCYELAIMMLQNAGIVKKDLMPSSYFPKHIMYGHLPLEGTYEYSKTVLVNTHLIVNFDRVI
jgi:hypothetical protein